MGCITTKSRSNTARLQYGYYQPEPKKEEVDKYSIERNPIVKRRAQSQYQQNSQIENRTKQYSDFVKRTLPQN